MRHSLRSRTSVSHPNLLHARITDNALTLEFCVRGYESDSTNRRRDADCSNQNTEFPRGSYCLLNGQPKPNIYERCPPGFQWSAVGVDDVGEEDRRKQGKLPTGEYFETFTHYYFCCRNDSNPASVGILPTERPFILFPLVSQKICQELRGLQHRLMSIYLDTENGSYDNFPNRYNAPFVETNSVIEGVGPCSREKRGRGLQIYLCYYSRA